jgi:hypothetical protein
MSFDQLISNTSNVANLVAAATEAAGSGDKKSYKDEAVWKPTVDKAGNGYAVLRFLPASQAGELPWAKYWDHGFKGPTGRWYIEKSLTSIGQKDPLGEMNQKLWNSGNEDDKATVRERKRRLHYVSNVYVVADPSAPENEGKVFKFIYGKKIFDKIMDVMQPQFPGEVPVDPFHFMQGADFQLKIRNVEGYRNYDKSEFTSPAPLLSGDVTQLEAVYNQMHDLSEYTDPSKYPTYEELEKKLNEVLGTAVNHSYAAEDKISTVESAPAPQPKTAESGFASTVATAAAPEVGNVASAADDDDTMSYFAKLAQEN